MNDAPLLPSSSAALSATGAPAATVLPVAVLRGLNDKLYERRKLAALDVERIMREAVAANDAARVQRVIELLSQEFAYSVHGNARSGGLIGLAAVAIALGVHDVSSYLHNLIPPVLACLSDQESRVRYYACESMYNVFKVARGHALVYFNEVFDALSKLAADPEISVKNGADLLDRLLKDIVAENSRPSTATATGPATAQPAYAVATDPLQTEVVGGFILPNFIPLLAERIYTVNPFTRSFLISWLSVLDALPDLELVSFLPDILDGLLGFVGDPNVDVRTGATTVLGEFLREIKEIANGMRGAATSLASSSTNVEDGAKSHRAIDVQYTKLIQILLPRTRAFANEETQAIALEWLGEFVTIASRRDIVDFVPELVASFLPCLANVTGSIRARAEECDERLRQFIIAYVPGNDLDYPAVINALAQQSIHASDKTRAASLEWLLMIHRKAPRHVLSSESGTFPILFKTLSDPSEEVVKRDLELLAQLACSKDAELDYFKKVMASLATLFSTDRNLLEARGSLIVRELCRHLDAERIYRTFAEILESQTDDWPFASTMVQNLNTILVTAPELRELRNRLKRMHQQDGRALFFALYRSWAHNSISTFTLCLLAQAYEHAAALLRTFTEFEITVDLLIQIDKLVQLLESPVFTYLRLQLLEPEMHPYLFKCMYGLLMLLPQSAAFATLRNRLSSVSNLGSLQLLAGAPSPSRGNVNGGASTLEGEASKDTDFAEMLVHFRAVQLGHARHDGSGGRVTAEMAPALHRQSPAASGGNDV